MRADEPPIELHQSLVVTVQSAEFQNWTRKRAFVIRGRAEIVQFIPKYVTRVDGISLPDCRNLQTRFGQRFPLSIASDPSILKRTRYSAQKATVIVQACQRELTSEAKHGTANREIVNKLCACCVPKNKARYLAGRYDPKASPYQFFLTGGLTYLQADRFAQLLDPARAAADRLFLFIVEQFIDAKHVIIPQRKIQDTVWLKFGAGYSETEDALTRLIDLKVVWKIEKHTTAIGGAIRGEIGERVTLFDSDRFDIRPGVISALPKFPNQSVEVALDDGEITNANPKYLQSQTIETQTWFGLARFVEAEENIASILSHNDPIELSADDLSVIEWVLDHAAEVLNRPGFVPNEAQRRGARQTFQYRFSIVTGPPGTGKTAAVIALVCAIAARLYPDVPQPVLGVALAGRAASVMRSASIFWQDGSPIAMGASTIHRALRMTSSGDDEFSIYGRIDHPVLASDESSMNDVRLMAALVSNTTARHVLFSGDENQLQPLGPGAPLRDMIASKVVPTVNLTQNYRSNCKGILALCNDILNGTISTARLASYLELGGVFYVPCDYKARPAIIAALYADLVESGLSTQDIRVLSPHNGGSDGTGSINLEIRNELNLSPRDLAVGDILLITENDYQAACCPGYPQVSGEEVGCEIIFNGELCSVFNVGPDFIDVVFEENCDGIRHVRLILNDGVDAEARLPDGVTFGRAMSVHKGQGSQFRAVIVPTEVGNKQFGIVQKSIIYTATSRGIDRVIIVGNFDDLVHAAMTPDLPRNTLLRDLLIVGAKP